MPPHDKILNSKLILFDNNVWHIQNTDQLHIKVFLLILRIVYFISAQKGTGSLSFRDAG